MFCKVTLNNEVVNTESLLPGENTELGSWEPLVKMFLSNG